MPSCGGYWFWAFYSEGRWPKLLTKLWDGTLWTSTMIRLELYGMKMSRNRGITTPIWRILTWKSWYVVRKLYQTFCIEWNCEYIFFLRVPPHLSENIWIFWHQVTQTTMKQRHIDAHLSIACLYIISYTLFLKFFQYTYIVNSINSLLVAKSSWPVVIEFSLTFIPDMIVFVISYVYLNFFYCCLCVYVASLAQV